MDHQTPAVHKNFRNLFSRTIPVASLSLHWKEEMWALFEQYYADVSRETFEKDLSHKNHVILIQERDTQRVKGFSTLQRLEMEVKGKKALVIFSGDTIVEKEYWGQTVLQKAFLGYVLRQKLSSGWVPTYWFLISKGYKTYLLLSRNFPVYWPRHDRPTPVWENELLSELASHKFGEAWIPELGILHFPDKKGRLKEDVAPIDEKLFQYPDIAFFARKNPGHLQGDELCCLGLVDFWLPFSYGKKLLFRKVKKWAR